MVRVNVLLRSLSVVGASYASCPFALNNLQHNRAGAQSSGSRSHLEPFDVDDSQGFLTTNVGGPIGDQQSLKAGTRGPTLLEDFILREKITHFGHERIPERAVHARGAGAHGTFTSYGNFDNITAASFLNAKDKTTPVFVRFSTTAGSRGSSDMVRDVHGFAVRFYTEEGNLDIVGTNIPVFHIQDAIQFPDLVHAVKPAPNKEIPQAQTAHDSAWDFFSQQSSGLHTLFWVMAGDGIPRSVRHINGHGIHTYRFVTDVGETSFVKWHFKSMQGKASLIWDEVEAIAGKNPDFHRQDLFDAIEKGNYPAWELSVQIFSEEDALTFGFDVLDPTKFIPEETVPLSPLGIFRLDVNPVNYFAETEQVMFHPGHIVRGIDFTEDPLLQGRLFAYTDAHLNRNGGPNFEQLPINRPVVAVHSNNRDGAGQASIHTNKAPYTPNTINNGFPAQADQARGRGFFTSPGRSVSGSLVREQSSTFSDHWSQTRLFYNSLTKVEQQFLINAIRFETSKIHPSIQKNVLIQLNKVSNDIARRVAETLGQEVPTPDPLYYHNDTIPGLRVFGQRLPTIVGLKVGILCSEGTRGSLDQALALKDAFQKERVNAIVVAETLRGGVDQTYSTSFAGEFDGIIVTEGSERLFDKKAFSTLFPNNRPTQIVTDGYNWGKPLGFLGSAQSVIEQAGASKGPGVFAVSDVKTMVDHMSDGLSIFKFTDRFALDA